MKRQPVIRRILDALNDNDIAIFSESLSREAYEYDRENNFYVLDSNSITPSFGLGIAMRTDKRVFIFVSDGDFLKSLGAAPQISASKCRNVFYVILHSGVYQNSGGFPNIFREMNAPKGLLFNFGFLVHDYTNYLKNKRDEKLISRIIERVRGPLAILIAVDRGINKNLKDVPLSEVELKNRLINLVANKEMGTSLYNSPITLANTELKNKEE